MDKYKIVEKKNPLAVHGLFSTYEKAETFLRETLVEYIAKGYFMDKTLRVEDFIIKEGK